MRRAARPSTESTSARSSESRRRPPVSSPMRTTYRGRSVVGTLASEITMRSRATGSHLFDPPHLPRIQRSGEPPARAGKHAFHRILRLQRLPNGPAQLRVVDPARGAIDRRSERFCRCSHGETSDVATQSAISTPAASGPAGNVRDHAVAGECYRDDRDQRDRAFEEQVGKGKPVILVEDRERQRDGRVMPHELNRPPIVAGMEAAEM